jgi:hypothetical protein
MAISPIFSNLMSSLSCRTPLRQLASSRVTESHVAILIIVVRKSKIRAQNAKGNHKP